MTPEDQYVFDTGVLVSAALFPESIPGLAVREGLRKGKGDRDLLALNPFQGVAIVSPAEFLATLTSR